MNFFPQPCLALSDSPKLRAKQGHGESTTFAPKLHPHPPVAGALRSPAHAGRSRVRPASAPRTLVGAWRPLRAKARPGNAGRESSVPRSPITNLPFRPWRPLREPSPTPHAKSATFAKDFSDLNNNPLRPWRPWRAKARPGNAGRESSVPRSPITNLPFRPWRPWREQSAFTLIELMAATTVLSVILLMMVGMQDQMSKAWANSNRRTDATREARAAVQMISSDLSGLLTRQNTNMDGFVGSIAIANMGLPFVYSSNGVNSSGLNLPTSMQPGSSFLFGVCTKKSRSPTDPDLAIFGYYIGRRNGTNINGFPFTNYNLYRYVVPNNTAAALSGITTGNLNTLFPNIADNSEILARNTCNLRIRFYNSQNPGMPVTNGPNYRVFSACTANNYSGSKIHIELSAYPEDSAQKIPLTAWANSNNIQKYARSFEFRIDVPRTITH